jgi:hypothetical protein
VDEEATMAEMGGQHMVFLWQQLYCLA